jgi:pimeloyl-ACP methyl ester carboxylesterase
MTVAAIGRPDDSGDGFDDHTHANDLAGVLETLDLRQALVSHSMGAGEVPRYLSRHGAARVPQIILIAPAGTPQNCTPPSGFVDAPHPPIDAAEQLVFPPRRIVLLGERVTRGKGGDKHPPMMEQKS